MSNTTTASGRRAAPRYRLVAVDRNVVDLTVRVCGQEATRRFWAPWDGGYVRDTTHQPGTLGPQVCTGLDRLGPTLDWDGRGPLVDLIRREMRRLLRDCGRVVSGHHPWPEDVDRALAEHFGLDPHAQAGP